MAKSKDVELMGVHTLRLDGIIPVEYEAFDSKQSTLNLRDFLTIVVYSFRREPNMKTYQQ